MSCFPVPTCLKRFGRTLRMFGGWMNNWRRLEEDKENMSIDHTPTSHYLPPSPMQMSIDDSMHSWRQTHRDSPNKTYAIPTYLRQKNLSESSSGYDSSHSPKEPSGFDFRIYDDLMNIQDISMPSLISGIPSFSSFNEISFPYSPLPTSSRRSLSSSFLSFDIENTPPTHDHEYEQLRQDFEKNGRTLDDDDCDFVPSVSSTPKAVRRYEPSILEEEPIRKLEQYRHIPTPRREANRGAQPWRSNKIPQKKLKPHKASLKDHCVFCKNNGMPESAYKSHTTKDAKGKVLCPKLRAYNCPICGEHGDNAHTTKYCPKKPIITLDDINQMSRKNFVKIL